MGRKGQVTIEFIVAVSILLFIFSFSLYAFSEKNKGFTYSKESFNAKLLAQELAGKINAVFIAGDGTEATVLLKNKGDFNVSISGNSVRVFFGGEYADSKILTGNIIVTSLSLGGKVNVKNKNGGIIIENA